MCFLVGLAATLILAGWLVDLRILTALTPYRMIAKANTALGMLLMSVATALTLPLRPTPLQIRIAHVCAGLASLLALTTLVEYCLHVNLGIDELLALDAGAVDNLAPGRVPRVTAIGLLAMSIALVAQISGRRTLVDIGRVLLWLTIVVAAQALISYAIEAEILLGGVIYAQMSLHSTLMFIGLCSALLLGQRVRLNEQEVVEMDADSAFQGRLLAITIIMPPALQSLIQLAQKAGFLGDETGMATQISINAILMLTVMHLSIKSLRARSAQIRAEQVRVARLSEHVDMVEREKAKLDAERQVALAVRENEERLQALLEGAFDAVVSINAQGQVTAWNGKAEEMFGWPKDKAIGQPLPRLIVPEAKREAHTRGLERYMKTGQEVVLNREVEMTACCADGSPLPVRMFITPVQISGSQTFTAFISDISARRLAETELRRAQATAEQAAAVKAQFLAQMSHEIRTPLNGILGMTETLLDGDLTPSQKQTAHILQGAGQQLLGIVNDILDFSKMEGRHLKLESLPFDLRGIMQQRAALMRSRAHDKGLQLVCDVREDAPTYVLGDEGRLSQIILNLLSNGIKFTKAGTIILRVASTVGGLRFSVQDSGIGMTPEVQRGLFQPFFQADSSTSRRYGGTGLGLAISRQLVELMGGTLHVTSNVGQGSTFWFDVPLKATDKEPRKLPTAEAPKAISIDIDGTAPKVLVAEDNEVNRLVVSTHLRKLGCETRMTCNGREAVEAFKEEHFDIVLMDCHMPEMDGFEATSLIREHEAELHAHTPIVALTASALPEDVERCLQAGMDAHLCKPVQLRAFAEVLKKHLEAAAPRH